MPEMHDRSKWYFWAIVATGAVLVCVPSTVFLQALQRYRRFVEGFEPGPLKPMRVRFTPHKGNGSAGPVEPRLEFVDFKLDAPRTRRVHLIGEFNAWKPGTLALAKDSKGEWELTLPLPPGRYHYLFVVDGRETLDPANPETGESEGRKASLKVVR